MILKINLKTIKHLTMLFGELKRYELEKIKFPLPKDTKDSEALLKKGSGDGKVFLGCAKWGRKEWIGKIYPKGTKEKDFLEHYAQHYQSIELNATHYKLYSAGGFESWVQKVNSPSFKFCPKAHRGMSF